MVGLNDNAGPSTTVSQMSVQMTSTPAAVTRLPEGAPTMVTGPTNTWASTTCHASGLYDIALEEVLLLWRNL